MKNANNHTRRIFAMLLALVLVCSVTAGLAYAAPTPTPTLTFASEGHTAGSAAEVYARNVNSTVAITTEALTNYFGYDTISGGSGSGFIITEDGYILTNYHVVQGANTINVEMYNGDTYKAELIGCDDSNDIAVLKIDAKDLTPVTFGDSDKVVVGEDVVAIGNPLGELHFSLTRGVVSALDRNLTLSGNMHLKLIQTDCAINSGNSGGALFNMYGEVIGITNAKISGGGFGATVDNIAFAIPVNTVVGIVEQIMTKGEISKPYIGVTVTPVKDDLLAYGIPRGAEIVSVNEDSPAEEAGLKEKDIVIAANGEDIRSSDDLVKIVTACEPGEKLELTVYRAGEKVNITVTVGENVKSALPETEEDLTETK